jgi:hypothetical protein
MLSQIQPDIWIPAISGTVGALVGAGASVLGILVKGGQDRRQQREAVERESREKEQQQTASALGEALSFLHDGGMLARSGQLDRERVAAMKEAWPSVRSHLLLLVVTDPKSDVAARTLRLVGGFSRIIEALSSVGADPQAKLQEEVGALRPEVEGLLNEVRQDQGLDPLP